MSPRRRLSGYVTAFAAMVLALCTSAGAAAAQAAASPPLEGRAVVEALRGGGYTIYFRHAATDWSSDDRIARKGDWTSCDPAEMRQLSDAGRAAARRIGAAIRALGIPVGRVLSSEYCRSADTAREMGLGEVETTRDIMNMRAAAYVGGREAVIRRARRVLTEGPPSPDVNQVVVGHGNLMRAATDAYASEGGSGIYAPRRGAGAGAEDGFALIARLGPEDWAALAKRFGERN